MSIITSRMPRNSEGWYLMKYKGMNIKIEPWKSVVSLSGPADGTYILPNVSGKMYLIEAIYLQARVEAAGVDADSINAVIFQMEDPNANVYFTCDVKPAEANVWTASFENVDAFTSSPNDRGMHLHVNGTIASTSFIVVYRNVEFI